MKDHLVGEWHHVFVQPQFAGTEMGRWLRLGPVQSDTPRSLLRVQRGVGQRFGNAELSPALLEKQRRPLFGRCWRRK